MKLKFVRVTLAAVVGLCVAIPARAERVDRNSVTVDSAGTKTETTQRLEDSKTLLGNQKQVSETSTEVDPRGLGNKTTSTTTVETVRKPNGDTRTSSQKVHPDGTYEEHTSERQVAENLLNSGSTETKTDTTVVDPVGLGNKSTTTTTEVVERRPDGSAVKTVTKEINGQVVSRESNVAVR